MKAAFSSIFSTFSKKQLPTLSNIIKSSLVAASLLPSAILADNSKPQNPQASRIDAKHYWQQRQNIRKLDTQAQINYLLDKAEITDVVTAYGYSVDTADAEFHASLFTESYLNLNSGKPRSEASQKRGKRIERFVNNFTAVQHLVFPSSIQIMQDSAYVTASINARHYKSDGNAKGNSLLIGQYEFWLVRTEQGWKINKMNMVNRVSTPIAKTLEDKLQSKQQGK